MAVYYKPQSPIQSGEDFIYPITTADQVKVDKDTRLNAVGVYLKNIDNSTDTTVYGNNATTLGGVAAEDYALKTDTAPDSSKLGGVAASDYALKTDTAPDSSKLGGKAPEYYIQPRNLLDNSDFRNPVNQRGQTSYTGLSYYIDRWRTWNDAMSGNLTDNGLVLDNSGDSNNQFVQYLDSDTTTKLTGKILTLACLMETGRTYTVTVTGGETANNYDEMISEGCYLEIGTGNGGLLAARFYVKANSTSNAIVWAALYEGSYTADTLPPYVPKGYAAELAECQRYYRVFRIGGVGKGSYIGGVWPITPSLRIDRPTSKLIGAIITTNGETTIAVGGFDASMSCIRMDCLMTTSDFNWWQATYEVSADL